MNTNHTTIPAPATKGSTPSSMRIRTIIAIGAAAAIAVVTSSAAVHSSGGKPAGSEAPPATLSDYAELRALVDRGVVPRQALEPGPLSDARLRMLVDRGVVPRQALDPAATADDEAQTPSTAP
jgi:hypothetical protein